MYSTWCMYDTFATYIQVFWYTQWVVYVVYLWYIIPVQVHLCTACIVNIWLLRWLCMVYLVTDMWYTCEFLDGSVQWMMCMMCDLPCRYFDGGTLVHWVYDVWYTCAVVLHDLVKKSYCDYCGQYCDSRLRLQYNKQMVSWVYLLGYQGKCTQITGNLMFILNSNIQT